MSPFSLKVECPPFPFDRQFFWGLRYIDDLILRDCSDFAPSRLYVLQDPNWNVTAVCGSSGNVSERYAYALYGVPTFLSAAFALISGSAYDWETLFAGYRWDSEPTFLLSRHRFLHPSLGFWLARDPLSTPSILAPVPDRVGPLGSSLVAGLGSHRLSRSGRLISRDARPLGGADGNRYRYARSNPVVVTDPSGLMTVDECWAEYGTCMDAAEDWDDRLYCAMQLDFCLSMATARAACRCLRRATRYVFATLEDAGEWLADHPGICIGTIVVVGGVAFVVATGGSGALILAPAACAL